MKTSVSLLLLLAILLTACGAESQTQAPLTGHYAGQVEGSDAFIGLVTNGERLLAFFCDGIETVTPTVWGWFRGDLSGNTFTLTSENGHQLTGEFNAEAASGTITLADGTTLTFQAEKVNEPAGVYRLEETVEGEQAISGWIVLANGEVRGGRKRGTQLASPMGPPTGFVDPIMN